MTYKETCHYLYSQMPMFERQGSSGYKEGLSNTLALDEHLGCPHKSYATIHIAGTNGKGSTCAFIASVLNNAGIKTGLYTSPHLTRFNERVEIGGVIVSDEELTSAFTEVHECCNGIKLTYFEYTTLAALVCYRNAGVKAAVLEIGLGGRLDAVNILDADIAVITSIGLDHTRILGDTIEKIAFEKAGIIKKDKVCVTGIVEDKVKAVIKEICAKNQADVFFETDDFNHSFDEKDTVADKNLYCLISPVSFSCGNLVPAALKSSQKVTLLGKTSGGGSCVVLPLTTAYGTFFRISGPSRLAFTKNGSFYDIDQGAEPDFTLTFPETFYDREALTDYINSLR